MKPLTAALLSVTWVCSLPAHTAAAPITISPTSDGSLYVCANCNVVSDGTYVLVSGYIEGLVKFSTASITGPVGEALLALNPYALPLFGPNVDVYGYGTTIGTLDLSDANAGTLLGTLVLPPSLGFGQVAFFDVTSFVAATNAPYLAFNLRTVAGGTDVFSSLEYNYGHPAQLTVTLTPAPVREPTSLLLLGTGLIGVVGRRSLRYFD